MSSQPCKLGNKWNGLNLLSLECNWFMFVSQCYAALKCTSYCGWSLLLGQAPQWQAAAWQGEAQVILAGQRLAMQDPAGIQPSSQPALRKDFIFVRLHLAAARSTGEEAIPSPRAAPVPCARPNDRILACFNVLIFFFLLSKQHI